MKNNITPKQTVIIGGGFSIKPELEKLQKVLKNKCTIGLNYTYNYFPHCTFHSYVDHLFYTEEIKGLKELPLIIGKHHHCLQKKLLYNTIMLPTTSRYNKNIEKGVYRGSLVGIFALTMAIYLIKNGEIFLLGYDWGGKKENKDEKGKIITHFYQGKIKHRGIGKVNYYNIKNKGNQDFDCFKNLEDIKIYNVGLESKLEEFEKIDYNEFYKKLNNKKLDQNKIRNEIREQLKKINLIL